MTYINNNKLIKAIKSISIYFHNDFHISSNLWDDDSKVKYKNIGVDLFPSINIYYYSEDNDRNIHFQFGFLFWTISIEYDSMRGC